VSIFGLGGVMLVGAETISTDQQTMRTQTAATTEPVMLSAEDMKWRDLQDHPGMQFALLSGDLISRGK
jgi:hypothetical protein